MRTHFQKWKHYCDFLKKCIDFFANCWVDKEDYWDVYYYVIEHVYNEFKRNNISIVTHLGLYSFFTIGYYAVLLWGADGISKGIMTYGTLNAFLQLVQQLRAPMQNVSGILPQYYSALASAERLMELEEGFEDKPSVAKEKLNEITTTCRDNTLQVVVISLSF